MSVAQTIKAQVKAKVQSCPSVQVVYSAPNNNPSGWPAVFLTLSKIEGEFSSNAEDSRVYSYVAQAMMSIGENYPGQGTQTRLEYVEEVLETVIDEIINAIDTDFELDGTPVLYTNASDVDWGYVDYEGGVARAAEVTLSIYTEKTVV